MIPWLLKKVGLLALLAALTLSVSPAQAHWGRGGFYGGPYRSYYGWSGYAGWGGGWYGGYPYGTYYAPYSAYYYPYSYYSAYPSGYGYSYGPYSYSSSYYPGAYDCCY